MSTHALGRIAAALALVLAALAPAAAHAQAGGRLVIMGGGGFGSQPAVYQAILEGRHGSGPVCVVPTASASPESSLESAVEAFVAQGGPGSAVGIPQLTVDNPQSGSDPAVVEALGRCSGFYFVGGVQSRIVTVLRPGGRATPALDVLVRRWREGAVVSGSSAGAAIMSDPMIAGGASGAMAGGVRLSSGEDDDEQEEQEEEDGALPNVSMEPGLGFFPAALVDQHFLARGRFGRLLVAVLDLPAFDLGFGIDESTALVVEDGNAWPVGASGIVVVDARGASAQGGTTTGVRVHLMSGGDRFDLASRRVSAQETKRPLAAGPAVTAPEDLFSRWTFFHLLEGLGRSSQPALAVPVPGGSITLTKSPEFAARSLEGQGVEGTAAGLSVTGLVVELRRDR